MMAAESDANTPVEAPAISEPQAVSFCDTLPNPNKPCGTGLFC